MPFVSDVLEDTKRMRSKSTSGRRGRRHLDVFASASDITLTYACEDVADYGRPLRCSPRAIVWVVLLSCAGVGLVLLGFFTTQCCDYDKLYVSVGGILVLCALFFASFVVFDAGNFRQYMLHMLVPWMVCTTLLFAAIVAAFCTHLINVKLFFITSLPIFSLGVFTFGELFNQVGRQRVQPLRDQLRHMKDEVGREDHVVGPSSDAWTSRSINLANNAEPTVTDSRHRIASPDRQS